METGEFGGGFSIDGFTRVVSVKSGQSIKKRSVVELSLLSLPVDVNHLFKINQVRNQSANTETMFLNSLLYPSYRHTCVYGCIFF